MAGPGPGNVPIPDLTGTKCAVHHIVQLIETKFPHYAIDGKTLGFKVHEIIKAGSLGHGTAVEGNYDLDLVIYSSDITPHDVLTSVDDFQPWLRRIHQFFERELEEFEFERLRNRSLQFIYDHPRCKIKVDLLVSPHWDTPSDLYGFLKSNHRKREIFTVCASKWQKEFMGRQSPTVKNFIRQAKKWRDDQWPEDQSGEGRPSSYLISLLVIKAYNIAKSRREPFAQAMIKLVHREKLNVHWGRHRLSFYTPKEQIKLLPSRPRVVDPANPANNVWISGIAGYRPGHRASDYDDGDGNHKPLLEKISTIVPYFVSLHVV